MSRVKETFAKNNGGEQQVSAQSALDGDPQMGWACAGQNGERKVAVFILSALLPVEGSLQVTKPFDRHWSYARAWLRRELQG